MKGKLVLLLLLSQAALAQNLHQLVLNSAADKIRAQASQGANLNQQDINGDTPLHWAIEATRPEMVKLLLELGAAADIPDSVGRTPLFRAAEMGQTEVVGWLLDAGANPRSLNHTQQTPLHMACLYNRPQVVDLLLKKGADPNAIERISRRAPAHDACTYGSTRCLELLIKANARLDVLDTDGNTPLHLAGLDGAQMCAETLLRAHLDPNQPNDSQETPLMLAISRDHHQLADYLAERSQLTRPVLETAAQAGYLSVLRRIVDPPPGLLQLAAGWGRLEVVQYLLEQGVPIDSRGENGQSAYLAAAGAGRRELMELLLQHGADPNLVDANGNGAAQLVQSHIDTLKILIQMEERKRSASFARQLYHEDLRRSRSTLRWLTETEARNGDDRQGQ